MKTKTFTIKDLLNELITAANELPDGYETPVQLADETHVHAKFRVIKDKDNILILDPFNEI
jgi:hypothetical protein